MRTSGRSQKELSGIVKWVLFSAALLLVFNACVYADLMAIWDFGPDNGHYTEDVSIENVSGTPGLVLLGGEKDPDGKNGTSFTDVGGNYHAGGQAAGWDDIKVAGDDAEWIMTINTTGWFDLAIRWDYKCWIADTNSFDLEYRVGTVDDWAEILNNQRMTADGNYHSFLRDLSTIAAIENQPFVQFRFCDIDRYGNDRFAFDNLQVSGVPIPEPATLLLLASGFLVLRRRKQISAA